MATPSARVGSGYQTVLRSAGVVIASLALGILTAYAQEWLPLEVGSLANSAGSWALVAFALSLLATNVRLAAMFGFLSLLGLVGGYVLGAGIRGDATSSSIIVFWGAAALFAGPLLGLGAYWVKTRRDLYAAAGVGAISGVLIGEGIYGLTQIADTTYPPFWWAEIVLGLILLLAASWRRLAGVREIALAVGMTVLSAASLILVFRRGPLEF